MTRLVILSQRDSPLTEELKKHFSLVTEEVVVKATIAPEDQFIIDLTLLDEDIGSEDITQTNFSMLKHAHQFAQEDRDMSMYVMVGYTDLTNKNIPGSTGFLGLAKTADQEWPNTMVKAIGFENIQNTSQMAQSIFDEVMKGGLSNEVFYDQELQRIELQLQVKESENSTHVLKPYSTLLVTGGGRGVTADCIMELAGTVPLNFAILGRTQLFEESSSTLSVDEKGLKGQLIKEYQAKNKKIDLLEIARKASQILANREIKNTLHTLQELGSKVSYHAVDVTDLTVLRQTMQEITSHYGSVEGLIHGAGVLADKYIKDKTEEQFLKVFETKVRGFKNLLEVTKDQPLNHICCFTSISGRFGNTGQSDYAMANEVLNKWCIQLQEERGASCNVKALNWGPWEGGMVTPEIRAQFEQKGIHIIPRKEGSEAFVREMQTKGESVEVVIGDGLHHWKRQAPKQHLFSCWIHESTLPVLKHHSINETVVMPMAGIIGQTEGIGHYYFDNTNITVQDVKVLNGVKVHDFNDKGLWLTYKVRPEEGQLQVEVFSSTNKLPHYTLSIHNRSYEALHLEDLTNSIGSAPKSELIEHPGYFHGEDLQVIAQLEAISKLGSDYEVGPFDQKDYRLKLMDGAYQAACVQAGFIQDVSYVIPMGCQTFHWFRHPKRGANLQYKLRVTDQSQLEFISNIQLIDRHSQEVYFETKNVLAIIYQTELAE